MVRALLQYSFFFLFFDMESQVAFTRLNLSQNVFSMYVNILESGRNYFNELYVPQPHWSLVRHTLFETQSLKFDDWLMIYYVFQKNTFHKSDLKNRNMFLHYATRFLSLQKFPQHLCIYRILG